MTSSFVGSSAHGHRARDGRYSPSHGLHGRRRGGRVENGRRGRIAEGDPADVLVRLAEQCSADILVVGNKGMEKRLLGSVPNTVTDKAGCSVLVVKTT
jgi:nucleotide-binding universal stress UspA family protein